MADIALQVAVYFGLKVSELRCSRRFRRLAYPRFLFCLLARELACKSYPEIAAWLGGRDHTTIIHAEQRALELIESRDDMAAAYLSIQNMLKEGDE